MSGWRGKTSAVFHQAFPACCISAIISGLDPCCPSGGPGFYTVSLFFRKASVGEVFSCCPAWCVEMGSHL